MTETEHLELVCDNARLMAELDVTEKLLSERQRVLDAIPECPLHGSCVPHALEWIAEKKKGLGRDVGCGQSGKVYCGDCTYYIPCNLDRGYFNGCDHPKNKKPNWKSPTGIYKAQADEINMDNDCKWFKAK